MRWHGLCLPGRRSSCSTKKKVMTIPEGPSTQHLRSLVPNTIRAWFWGTRNLKYWVLGLRGNEPAAQNTVTTRDLKIILIFVTYNPNKELKL